MSFFVSFSCCKGGQTAKLVVRDVLATFAEKGRSLVVVEDRWCGRGNKVEVVSGGVTIRLQIPPRPINLTGVISP